MNFRDPLLSSGLAIDPVHWVVITTLFKTKLAELENRFGVKFCYTQDKVKARAEISKDAVTLEGQALRALLCLYQRVTTSVLSCSLQSQSQSQSHLVEQRLAGLHGVVPDFRGDQWRIIGLPEDLRRAVDLIESDLGGPVFREEDKQRIGHLRYGVDSSGGRDMAGGASPVRGAPAAEEEEEDKCPVCMDQITNRRMLPCHHALCKECLENLVTQMGPTCPICKALFGELTGDQPDGRMTYETQRTSLPGFWRYGHILIKYEIPHGKQTVLIFILYLYKDAWICFLYLHKCTYSFFDVSDYKSLPPPRIPRPDTPTLGRHIMAPRDQRTSQTTEKAGRC
jgi:hypothetical protein